MPAGYMLVTLFCKTFRYTIRWRISVNLFPITAYYLTGPLVYIITKHALFEGYEPSKRDLSHFITPTAITLMATVMIFSSDYQYTPQLHGYYYNGTFLALAGLGILIFAVYLGFSIAAFVTALIFSKSVLKSTPFALAALSIVVSMILGLVLDGLAIAFNARIYMELALFTLNLVLISLFFILAKYPDYEKTVQAVVEKERKRRSYLAGINVDLLEERIRHLIKAEDVLADENLNLESMAHKVGVSKHQLSEFLNQHIGSNFSSFIKRHRIEHAKKLLVQFPDRKILAVAFDVGFKSKSTFNTAFLHFERKTPAQFRQQNL